MKVLLLFLAGATAVAAQTSTWTGSGGGSWSTASNWTPAPPNSGTTTALVFNNTLQPSTNNDFTGGLTLNSLTVGSASGARSISGNPLIFAGTAPSLKLQTTAGWLDIMSNVQLNANLTVTGQPTTEAQISFNGDISGTAGMIIRQGYAGLSGNNNFTGPVSVSEGAILAVDHSGVGAPSGITVGEGSQLQLRSFVLGETVIVNRPLSLAGTLSSDAKKVPVLGGTLPGAYYDGPITLSGTGTIHAFKPALQELVDFRITGSINRSGNQLNLASTNGAQLVCSTITGNGNLALKTGSIRINSILGNGDLTCEELSVGTITTLGGDGLLSNKGDLFFTGAVSGNRNLAVSDGILALAPSNSFTGSIVLSDTGILQVSAESALGNAANVVQFSNGGILRLTSTGNAAKPMTSTGGVGWINPAFSGTISSNLSGTGGFGIGGDEISTLTGNNTFTGGLSIGSIVDFINDSNLGAPGGIIRLGSTLYCPATYPTLARPIEIGNGGTLGADRSSLLVSGNLSGPGLLTLAGNTTYTLTGTNTHQGGIAVIGNTNQPATLVIDSDARLGAPSAVLNFGRMTGLQELPGHLVAAGNLNIAATRSTAFRNLTVDTKGFDVTFNQAMAGYGIRKIGNGVLRLNTANTNTTNNHSLTVQGGTVRLGVNHALGTRGGIADISDGAVLDMNGFNLNVGNVDTSPGSELKLGAGALLFRSGTLYGPITGTGSVSLGESGYSNQNTYFRTANTFTGGLTLRHDAQLHLSDPLGLGAPGRPITIDGGQLTYSTSLASPLVIDSAVNLNIGSAGAAFKADSGSIVIQTQLTGTAPLRFLGGSTLGSSDVYDVRLLNAGNTFTGAIDLGQADSSDRRYGILGIVGNGSLGNTANIVTLGKSYFDGESNYSVSGGLRAYSDLTLPASRTIRLDGNTDNGDAGGVFDSNGHTFTIATAISELSPGTPLLKTGAGALQLTGTNTYTGETRVDAGTIGGTGSVAGSIRFDSGTTLAPGTASSIGTFTCRDLDMTTDATFAVNLASGSGADRLVATGDVFIGGGATLSIAPTGAVNTGSTFTILAKSGSDPVGGAFEIAGELLDEGETFTSGGIQWSITYTGGDGNDIVLTALSGGTPPATITPKLTNITITPAGVNGSGVTAKISATITGGAANGSILLEASTDLGISDTWETIQTIPLNASGGATITNVGDPGSVGLRRNFFRLRTP